MDTRLICLWVMQIINDSHPCKVPTHIIYSKIGVDRKRAIQRQIKFLVESGYLKRHSDYKLSKNT